MVSGSTLDWKVYSLVSCRSCAGSFGEVTMSWTTENEVVFDLHLLLTPFDKSLIYNKSYKGPKMGFGGKPAHISSQDKH